MNTTTPAALDDSVVQVNILGRDIWYDIREHRVLRWQERDGDMLVTGDLQQVKMSGTSTGCNDCGCGTTQVVRMPGREGPEAGPANPHEPPGVVIEASPADERITTIELHLNDKCNFRCDYCYLAEAGIDYHDNEMPDDVAFKAVDFLVSNLKPGEAGVIRFFGGEPLMSYELLQRIVLYGEETAARDGGKQIMSTINTNGTLLTPDRTEWLVKHNVKVTISIDGKEESHNRHRKYVSGNTTFGAVAKKAKQFFEKSGYLKIRSTINDRDFDIANSVLDLVGLAPSASKVKLKTECNYIGKKKIEDDDVEQLNEDHTQLALQWLEKIKNGETIKYGNFVEPMFTMLNSIKTSYRCGAARTLVGVSPKGDVYPCHRFIDVKELRMGHVTTEIDEGIREEFRQNRVEFKDPCRECWVRYFCGGGCAHNNFFTTGNIKDGNDVYCQIFRHEVKLGLYLYTEMLRDYASVERSPIPA